MAMQARLAPGDVAPTLILTGGNGIEMDMKQWFGDQKLIVKFCNHKKNKTCAKHSGEIAKIKNEGFKNAGNITFWFVVDDGAATAKTLSQKYWMGVLADPGRQAAGEWGCEPKQTAIIAIDAGWIVKRVHYTTNDKDMLPVDAVLAMFD